MWVDKCDSITQTKILADCNEIHTEGGVNLIAQLISSEDESISVSATAVLANLCIINGKR